MPSIPALWRPREEKVRHGGDRISVLLDRGRRQKGSNWSLFLVLSTSRFLP